MTHRRPVPSGLTRISAVLAAAFLGGAAEHADALESGMATTLARLKAAAEG